MKSFGRGPRGKRPGKKGDGFRVNLEINAPEVRVISDDGGVLGVYSVPQAVEMAQGKGMDLIEIAPNAKPPTCKIMDYGKWKYENKKKATQARKNQVTVDIKEVQIRPRTEQHDLDTKLRHARRFLLGGDKVKVNLRFSGREMAHQEVGYNAIKKMCEALQDLAIVEVEPKKEGRHLFCIIAPDAAKIKEYKKTQASQEETPAKDS